MSRRRRLLGALGLALLLAAGAAAAVRAWRRAEPDELRIGALQTLAAIHRAQEAAMAADARAGRTERARSLEELVAEGRLPAQPEARGYRLEVGRSPLPGHWRVVAAPLDDGLPWCGAGSGAVFWGPRPISPDPMVPRPEGQVSMELFNRPPPRDGWFGGR